MSTTLSAAAGEPDAVTLPADPAPRRRFRPYHALVEGSTWTATAQLLADFVLGIVWFTVAVTLVSTGLGMLITLLGVPILAVGFLFPRVVGIVDRARARALLGVDTHDPFRRFTRQQSWWERVKVVFADPAAWKGLLYCLLLFLWGTVAFVVVVTLWSAALAGSAFIVFGWWADTGSLEGGARVAAILGTWVAGLVLLAVTPYVVRAMVGVDRAMVRGLLGRDRTEELEARVVQLEESRAASVDSAAAELRRIERDLHDGAQQRLVSLAMDLGLARDRLARGEDPERAAELVAEAHEEAKRAIVELRELVRGIHPAVLTDRGLDAALSALAARSPVPVEVDVRLDTRPPAAVEATAYFVVAEALTNLAKHSRADHAWVRVEHQGDRLRVEVRDDGRGGATVVPGGGLAGLRDRVLAVEGRLRLASPPGGPTLLEAELPWPAAALGPGSPLAPPLPPPVAR